MYTQQSLFERRGRLILSGLLSGLPSWLNPRGWPWFVYLWVALVLAGWAAPVWRWVQRQGAKEWPTTEGRVDFVYVSERRPFFISTTPRGGGKILSSEIAYEYFISGHRYSGSYRKDFGSRPEADEFVRELQGRAVTVSYDPRNAAKSTLSDDAIANLQMMRSAVQAEPEIPSPDLPSWVQPFLWPLMALSVVGLALSIWIHVGALAGHKVAPETFLWGLHAGIFVVWFPAAFIAKARTDTRLPRDYWKAVLRRAPDWTRYLVYGFGGYAVVNFLLFILQTSGQHVQGGDPPALVWRGFSGHWMAFYAAAFAIFYAAASTPRQEDLHRLQR